MIKHTLDSRDSFVHMLRPRVADESEIKTK